MTMGKLGMLTGSSNLKPLMTPGLRALSNPCARSPTFKASLLPSLKGFPRNVAQNHRGCSIVANAADISEVVEEGGAFDQKVSFGTILISTGGALLTYGFIAYFIPGLLPFESL